MAAFASVKMVAVPSVWSLDAASRKALKCDCPALCVVGFLALAHISLVASPGVSLLPSDRVASGGVSQTGAVREDG